MKKILLFSLFAIFACVASVAENPNCNAPVQTMSAQRSVVFRTTQKLRATDGSNREIYFYTNRVAKWYSGNGRLLAEYTYTLSGGELFLYRNGEEEGKGGYIMSRDRINLSSITLNGVKYVRK